MDESLKFAGIANPFAIGEYGVQDNAKKILRYIYFHQQLMMIGCAQLPARADWELKLGMGRHAYEDAMAVSTMRERVTKLRISEQKIGKSPDPQIELLFNELFHAESDLEYASLIYGFVKPKLLEIYREHARKTQQIVDQPTVRMLQQIIWDLEEQTTWGQKMIKHLQTKQSLSPKQESFMQYLSNLEKIAGGFDAEGEKSNIYPDPVRSSTPYVMPKHAVRDSSMGPAVFYRTGMGIEYGPDEKMIQNNLAGGVNVIDMMRIRQEEMGAAENVASVIFEMKGMPWEFYEELTRHMWDEVRHTMFGQAALESEGYDWRSRPQFVTDYDFLIPKIPSMRYAYLSIGIEDFLMKRPGKVAQYEFCKDVVNHPLFAQFQDYDWADEVFHAQTGRKWTPQVFDEDLDTIRLFAAEAVAEFSQFTVEQKNMQSIRDSVKK